MTVCQDSGMLKQTFKIIDAGEAEPNYSEGVMLAEMFLFLNFTEHLVYMVFKNHHFSIIFLNSSQFETTQSAFSNLY